MREYGVHLTELSEVSGADCVIVAVAHNEFRALGLNDIKRLYADIPDDEKVLLDVKGLYGMDELRSSGLSFWRL